MGHSRLSPSGSSRWMVCPGSLRLEAEVPEAKSENEHTLRGTAAHYVLEQCMTQGQSPGYYLDAALEIDGADGKKHQVIINHEDTQAVFAAYDYICQRKDECPGARFEFEHEVNPGWWLGERADLKGTADCIIYGENFIEVIDYKHGSGVVVEAEGNTQLLLYAIGACATLNWEGRSQDVVIMMTIIQPRAPHQNGTVRSWALMFSDLLGRLEALTEAAKATDDPEAPLVPGEKQCRFCRAKAICPELQKQAIEVFKPVEGSQKGNWSSEEGTQQQNMPKTDWDAIERNLGRPVAMLTTAEKGRIIDMEPLVKAWFKAVLESAVEDALAGATFPQHKLVATTTRRKWGLTDEKMIQKLSSLKGRDGKKIAKADVVHVTPLSIAQAEKVIKPRLTERTWHNLEKLVVKPEGKPTLVPLTDSREPIKTVEEVFEPVAQAAPWD